jgi:hypothetical protein
MPRILRPIEAIMGDGHRTFGASNEISIAHHVNQESRVRECRLRGKLGDAVGWSRLATVAKQATMGNRTVPPPHRRRMPSVADIHDH